MKYPLVTILFLTLLLTAKSQTTSVKRNALETYRYQPGKYFDKKEYRLLAPPKKYGTFIYSGKPLKATTLLLNLNGKITSSPIEGIMISSLKKQAALPDTIKPVAKFLYNTNRGKIFALPLDNMPCLVPNVNSNMPIAKLDMKEYKQMPNALQQQKLIPQTEELDPAEKKLK